MQENEITVGQQYNPFKLFHGCFVPNWLLCRSEISQGAKLCFARVAQYAGENGKCYPALETIAKELGVQERMIRRYIDELEEFNLIKKHKRGQGKTNYYTFIWHKWSKSIVMECNQEWTDMSDQERNKMSDQVWTDMSNKENHIKESNEKNHKTITTLSVSPEEVFNLYNEIMNGKNFPQAKKLTSKRISQIKARTREWFKTIEDWRNYFLKVTTTDFLCNNARGWRPDLDWLLTPAKLIKVLEGAYGSAKETQADLSFAESDKLAAKLDCIAIYDKNGNHTGKYVKPHRIEDGIIYNSFGDIVGYTKP